MNINKIIELIKRNFSFLNKYGFQFQEEKLYNKNDQESLWYKLLMFKEFNGDIIRIGFYPQYTYNINTIILSKQYKGSLSIKEYLDHGINEPTHYVPMHELDKNNIESSLAAYAKQVEDLFDGKLNKVIQGDEWINVRSYDLRSDY